ncbi:MAG: tRNA (adenosine(37)-N6)-threonylcarbamoyltransferase complex ATPase subunit type 1 TsaE [Oscillospiraceae bacterium]
MSSCILQLLTDANCGIYQGNKLKVKEGAVIKSYLSNSTVQTENIAAEIAPLLKAGDVIAYKGGMGVGKTAFTRGLAKGLGVDERLVSSPTFALVHEYIGSGLTLYHFDMYRITSSEDLFSTGFYEYLEAKAVVAVEWSENIEADLPDNVITISLSTVTDDENSRIITIEGDDRF